MEKIIINGKEYQLDVDKALADGYLKEKDNKAHSWDEYKEKMFKNIVYYTDKEGHTTKEFYYDFIGSPHVFQNEEESIGIAAFCKLIQLRRDWIKDWEPNWNNNKKWVIEIFNGDLRTNWYNSYQRSFSFPTEEMAKEFLDVHKDLLEKAKRFI